MDANVNTEVVANPDVEALLGDLEFAEDPATVHEPEVDASADVDEKALDALAEEANDADVVVSDILDEDFLVDLDMTAKRNEAYASQEAVAMPDIADTKAGVGTTKVKKASTVSKSSGAAPEPRVSRDLSAMKAEEFILDTDAVPADLDANKAAVLARRPGQVKIAEKFDNLFVQLAAGRLPSVYVVGAFKLLDAKGEMTSAELVAHYKTVGLKDGTAHSQAGQIMVLFNAIGIATRAGQKLTLRPNSAIAAKLRAAIAPAS
jgi:hypothetical protein